MTDVKHGAAAFCPAQSMPAMLGRPFSSQFINSIVPDRSLAAGVASIWRAFLRVSAPKASSAGRRPDPTARAAIAELFATRAIPVAAIVLAAATGVVVGSIGVTLFTPSASDKVEQTAALTARIARLDGELDAWKRAADASVKATEAKLAKLTERMEKSERRVALAGAASETTGSLPARIVAPPPQTALQSVPSPQVSPVRSVPAQISALPTARPKLAILDGFRLRGVFDGLALVDSRFGPIEVEPGDLLPGGIRVETIQRRDGRWVVVTNRGLITSR